MKSKKTRERILDASLEMFNQKKASNVSTVQISAAMKISPGNLYYYYANKEDVIRCIWNERMSGALDELLDGTDKIETAEDLVAFLDECLKYMIEYRFFYTEISTLFVNDDELVEIYAGAAKRMKDSFTALVIRLGEAGKFINDEVIAVLAVQGAVASAVHMLNRYDVYVGNGLTHEDFIGFCMIRIVYALESLMNTEMKDAVYAELEARGFAKERFKEIVG